MSLLDDASAAYNALPPGLQTALKVVMVLLIGSVVVTLLKKYIDNVVARVPKADRTVRSFIKRLVGVGGWVVVIVAAMVTAGVDVTAMLGGLAIGGFVLGFALKDTLGNLAAGLMLLMYRPFNVGDTVTIDGAEGEVESLGMALTTILAADGRVMTLPNGKVLGGQIINHTRMNRRRADVVVGIDYDDDIDTAVKAILAALKEDPRVMADPAPSVRITGLADSSVNLQVRPWVATKDFWQAKADFHAVIKRAVEGAGCTIPFPQRVVHHAEPAAPLTAAATNA